MADCSAAMITIGGCIPSQEAFWNLLHALEADCAGMDDWCGAQDAAEWASYIALRVTKGETLVATNAEMAGGLFPTIEGWCQEYGLPYLRADDGHYAYGATNTAFRPDLGYDDAVDVCGTIEEGPCFPMSGFDTADREEGNSAAQLLTWYRRAFSPLPPLTLAEGVDPELPEPAEHDSQASAPAGFDPAKVTITRHRQSVTQQEVTIAYDGRVIWNHAGDDMQLRADGEYRGHDDAYWIEVTRKHLAA